MPNPDDSQTRSLNAERIDQIIQAITEEGPLTYEELLPRMPGLKTEERVREIVAIGKKWGVLQNLTGDGDMPAARMKGKGGATHFVEISRGAGCVVGLNVGRTYFAIGVADPNGRLLSTADDPPRKGKQKRMTKERAWRKYRKGQMIVHERPSGKKGLPLLRYTAAKTIERLGELGVADEELRAVTLSLPVPVSTTKGSTLTSSIEPTLSDMNVDRQFRLALGKDRFPKLEKVVLANDADVAARGEVRYGKAHGKRDVIAIHAAYGVGAGVITDGRILRTGAGGGAGEIGHCIPRLWPDASAAYGLPALDPEDALFTCVCGGSGHLEAMAGGAAIVKRISADTVKPKPPKRLAELLASPDKTVAEKLDGVIKASTRSRPWKPGAAALSDAARLLGGAVHTVTHMFHPEAVYLSGKLSEAGEPFLLEVKEAFEQLDSISSYSPLIELGTASGAFNRRLIMVRGAAMTAVRSTKPLITKDRLEELEEKHKELAR